MELFLKGNRMKSRYISNQLKAAIFIGDITKEETEKHKEVSATLMEYAYECSRSRNELGIPYGELHSTNISFILRNVSEKNIKTLMNNMISNQSYDYSFVFNAVFDSNRRLSHYDDAFIAKGFVVDLEELFDNYQSGKEILGQRTIKVKILLSSITYLGIDHNLVVRTIVPSSF